MNPNRLIRPPRYLSDIELWRAPKSPWDQRRIERARKQAKERFNRSRLIFDINLDLIFPGISESCAAIQSAVIPEDNRGNVSSYELIVLASICKYLNPKVIFEFGTFNGHTTWHFALNSLDSCQILTIDLAPDDPLRHLVSDDTHYITDNRVGLGFKEKPEAAKITQIFGNSMTFDHLPYKGKVDLIFIDAGHEYEAVRSDSEKALEMVSSGGVILWHDYVFSHFGVYTWLNELSKSVPLCSLLDTSLVLYQHNAEVSKKQCSEDLEKKILQKKAAEWDNFRSSNSYRIATQLYSLRKTLFPVGSTREKLLTNIFRR